MRRPSIAICLALAALTPLAAPAAASAKKAAKSPVVTRVTPMRLHVGDAITIRGRNFSSRRSRNTVIFRGPDGRSAFAKPRRASGRKLVLVLPPALSRILGRKPTRFRLRVVTRRFSRWTPRRLSPVIVPERAPSTGGSGGGGSPGSGPTSGGTPTPPPPPDCDGDGNPDSTDSDDDNDLLSDTLEATLGTDRCKRDTDGDGVEDGYEYKSAVDLNDDEFQDPNTSLPYPGKRPYPNPLDPSDANTDYDGDSLSSAEEQKLWKYTIANGASRTLNPLTYSAGEQYSISTRGVDGRRVPTLLAAGYSKQQDFLDWASAHGYRQVVVPTGPPWYAWYDSAHQAQYGLLDFNRSGTESTAESVYYDSPHRAAPADGYLSDDERDEDADGLTNYMETHGPAKGADWWKACYTDEKPFPVNYAGTDFTDPDSDGDGVRDGADDQDHDDIPNVMELSRRRASGLFDDACKPPDPAPDLTGRPDLYGRVNPFNPCLPDPNARTCPDYIEFGNEFAPFDGSPDWYSLN